MSWSALPGLRSTKDAFGETTVTVERERIRDACARAREDGFTFLADIVATDYLGWGARASPATSAPAAAATSTTRRRRASSGCRS